ncbi:beta-ketoacyl synthase chain length factor [Methylomicrobium sp. Wu6]|uniref:beta-ketoacyl synthase chain length factor n=1 Tax=Methylomicrobium sp. Wu6 TaxID=3107928 RepID=UPI002DD64AF4|nr:beta-ketoacyl synthase chain length factor [Methylomicrobium sp. Wu6]MEC4747108.1 beta-ketoacyl synthase chain length factor [Methylomicrobium sp. Wu6]
MSSVYKVADFVLSDWSICAPGLHGREGWGGFRTGAREIDNALPKIPDFIPKLQQRRLSPLARLVFNAIDQCLNPGETLPTVFSSAHGEVGKALEMLQMIQAGEELSPTVFSLSVHNAIAGLYSIVYHNQQEITVMAPGLDGLAPAFLEALGLLQEGAGQVLVVLYDEPIAEFYPLAPFKLNAEFPCALALRLSLDGAGMALRLRRAPECRDDREQPLQLPPFIDFLLGDSTESGLIFEGRGWRWEKI